MRTEGGLRGVSRGAWSVSWDAHVPSPRSGIARELAALTAHASGAAQQVCGRSCMLPVSVFA